jgi:kumamolisin
MSHIQCRPYFRVQRPPAPRPDVKISPHAASAKTWTVPALCKAYQWPTDLKGTGIIGILELGGGFGMPEIETFFKNNGLPMPKITVVSVDGTPNDNAGGGDADIEVALDIQVAGASFAYATGRPAEIRVYFAQDIAPIVTAAAKEGCAVLSCSWGADETSWGKEAAEELQAACVAANALGMTIFAAAGDNDSDDGGGKTGVDCPGSCPNVVCCGGTSKPHAGEEVVWNDTPGDADGEGTGGGYSKFFPVQAWQTGAPKAPAGLGRMVPDVAANADPDTGYEIFVHGAPLVVGGTSAVAPLYAGLFAAMSAPDDKLGDIGRVLWASQKDFVDITQGENGVYHAAVGPDPCSGLGVPIGTALAETFGVDG